MAVGFSGSNGGIGPAIRRVSPEQITLDLYREIPLEISYFINNVCNLHCAHCYVNYEKHSGGLSLATWQGVFSDLIQRGARTFGNVGMEPLLTWRKSRELMLFLKDQRGEIPNLRFGLVTNGTLLSDTLVGDLSFIDPDYIDVSVDGDESSHDTIRGKGMFWKTVENLQALPLSLREKVFISFTLNRVTCKGMEAMIHHLSNLGIRHFLISPYATVQNTTYDHLWMHPDEMAAVIRKMVDSLRIPEVSIYVKSDFDTSHVFMNALVEVGLIDLKNLYMDEYGVVFCVQEKKGGQKFFFNYMGMDTKFIKDIRISHDGYVGGCLDMFFKDYPSRTIGNILQDSIGNLLNIE